MQTESVFARSTPVVPIRGIHMDLKGTPPTPRRFLEHLELFARLRFNAVLIEWEDMFPWTVDERCRCETAYTLEDVRRFCRRAEELHLEVIPLVQCLGHMETWLAPAGYESLRELPYRSDVLNVLADGAGELVRRNVLDVLEAWPAVKRFHLGGDEAWSFGRHADTRAFIDAHGKGALYLKHVEPILQLLNGRGIRPILWSDMMESWDDASLRRLAGQADLCVWGYQGRPDATSSHHSTRYIERFAHQGVTLWGATAFKGASAPDSDLPDVDLHTVNAVGWTDAAARYPLKGLFVTAWSRYSTHNVCCDTTDASLDSLVNVAVIAHDGQPPTGGRDACRQALSAMGELARFAACHAAMKTLSDGRQDFWTQARLLREQIAMCDRDPRRRTGSWLSRHVPLLREVLAAMDQAAHHVRLAYKGLVDELWIGRYLAERMEPMREELALIETHCRRLDPVGWACM